MSAWDDFCSGRIDHPPCFGAGCVVASICPWGKDCMNCGGRDPA
ncbi:MAG: hypothetical protein NO515_07870 [Candidatus Methanomethylicia archaeon]|nr:hypothetical protein [Candidatus Methanomethylicia archaeon]